MIYSDVTTYFLGKYFINTTIYVVSAFFSMNRIEDFVDGMVDQHGLLFCQVLFALSFKTEVIFLKSLLFFDCNSFNDSMMEMKIQGVTRKTKIVLELYHENVDKMRTKERNIMNWFFKNQRTFSESQPGRKWTIDSMNNKQMNPIDITFSK